MECFTNICAIHFSIRLFVLVLFCLSSFIQVFFFKFSPSFSKVLSSIFFPSFFEFSILKESFSLFFSVLFCLLLKVWNRSGWIRKKIHNFQTFLLRIKAFERILPSTGLLNFFAELFVFMFLQFEILFHRTFVEF